jgi:hypothetical protein
VAVRRCHANPLMADSSPRYGGGFKAESYQQPTPWLPRAYQRAVG